MFQKTMSHTPQTSLLGPQQPQTTLLGQQFQQMSLDNSTIQSQQQATTSQQHLLTQQQVPLVQGGPIVATTVATATATNVATTDFIATAGNKRTAYGLGNNASATAISVVAITTTAVAIVTPRDSSNVATTASRRYERNSNDVVTRATTTASVGL